MNITLERAEGILRDWQIRSVQILCMSESDSLKFSLVGVIHSCNLESFGMRGAIGGLHAAFKAVTVFELLTEEELRLNFGDGKYWLSLQPHRS